MAGKSLNKVQLIGNLGKDPELKYTANGIAVATFSVATSESYKSPDSDEWQERTEWHRVVAWRRTAEIAGEYLAKGRQVYIEGSLQTRSWDDQNGNKHYTTEIVARDLILLGSKGDSSYGNRPPHPADTFQEAPLHTGTASEPTHTGMASEPTHTGAAPAAPRASSPAPDQPPMSDDIPF